MVHGTRLCEGISLYEQTGTSRINVIKKNVLIEKHLCHDENVSIMSCRAGGRSKGLFEGGERAEIESGECNRKKAE